MQPVDCGKARAVPYDEFIHSIMFRTYNMIPFVVALHIESETIGCKARVGEQLKELCT